MSKINQEALSPKNKRVHDRIGLSALRSFCDLAHKNFGRSRKNNSFYLPKFMNCAPRAYLSHLGARGAASLRWRGAADQLSHGARCGAQRGAGAPVTRAALEKRGAG